MIKVIITSILFLFFTFSVIAQLEQKDVSTKDTEQKDTLPKYEKLGKRNPFIPLVTSDGQLINVQDQENTASLNLEGIIYDKDGQSMAIINGQILRKNDTIGDAKIVDIRKDGVVYVKDGEIFVLNVEGEE